MNAFTSQLEVLPRLGVVLAGGLSSRMGQDKALLTLVGKTFLARAAEALTGAGCQRLMLSGFPRPGWEGEVVPDTLAQMGPVGGLVSVLHYLNPDLADGQPVLLVMVPVDTPCLTSACLEYLLQPVLTTGVAESPAQMAYFADSPLPMALRLDAETAADLLAQLGYEMQSEAHSEPQSTSQRSPSIRKFCSKLRSVVVPRSAEVDACLCNVNTPDEWQKLNHP